MSKNKNAVIIICFLSGLVLSSVNPGFAQDKFAYDPAGKRDPFIQLVTPDGRFQKLEADEAKPGNSQLKLEGIMYDSAGASFAIVNGLVVKALDEVDGYQVVKINENSVIFRKGDQIKELRLKKEGM